MEDFPFIGPLINRSGKHFINISAPFYFLIRAKAEISDRHHCIQELLW